MKKIHVIGGELIAINRALVQSLSVLIIISRKKKILENLNNILHDLGIAPCRSANRACGHWTIEAETQTKHCFAMSLLYLSNLCIIS